MKYGCEVIYSKETKNKQTSSQSASEQFSITLVWYVTPTKKNSYYL